MKKPEDNMGGVVLTDKEKIRLIKTGKAPKKSKKK